MPLLNNDSIDDPVAFDAAESFASGQVSFQRASLLPPDAAGLLQDVVIRPLGEARTRRGLRKLGGDRAGGAGEGVQGLIFFSGPLRVGSTAPIVEFAIDISSVDWGSVSGGGTFPDGTSITVVATPNEIYYGFVNWTEGATVVSTSPSYTFFVHSARTLVANFQELTE